MKKLNDNTDTVFCQRHLDVSYFLFQRSRKMLEHTSRLMPTAAKGSGPLNTGMSALIKET